MKVSIYSIQKTLFEGEAKELIAHTSEGQITVLDDHLPLITALVGHLVEVVGKNNERKEVPLESGFLEVRPESEVVILANS